LELPGVLSVREGAFQLGEYARIEGAMEWVCRASAARVTPRGGVITRADLIEALSEAGCGGVRLTLRAPERIRLVPEESLAGAVRALASWPCRVEVRTPPGHWSLAEEKIRPGQATVRIRRVEGSYGRSARASLRWWGEALVPGRFVSPGEPIPPEVFRRVMSLAPGAAWVRREEDLLNREARIPLNAWMPIPLRGVKAARLVRTGEPVRIRGRAGGLILEVPGVALQGGASGDLVRVRNVGTRRELLGRVTGAGVVEVPMDFSSSAVYSDDRKEGAP
jgi:flagella basal body P-ring formation protein FlgA